MRSGDNLRPTIITIFGGSGDLANRKLVPALYNLYLDDQLPEKFAIIGLGRTEYTDEKFRNYLRKGLDEFSRRGKAKKEDWNAFKDKIHYLISDVFDDKSYQEIGQKIKSLEEEWEETAISVFYFAISPSLIEPVAKKLGSNNLCDDKSCSRIVVEKPFGNDLESAQYLNQLLTEIFSEEQIYRIDHYLGKEAVQNMLVFRFANILFEPVWNRNFIEHVQITASETVGVEDRGGFYDKAGALKDMIQNHVLQLLCFTAMEAPVHFNADEIRNRKVDVLRAIRQYEGKEVFKNSARGQYAKGWIKGEKAKGYREEVKVDPKSYTETFAAIRFFIDNWRWQNVPFYVRSGKRMPEKMSVITIQFRSVPHQMFPNTTSEHMIPNRIIISISPSTGIRIRFQAKKMGLDMRLKPAEFKFSYSGMYENDQPEAYENLLHDIMTGDATLFMRSDEVEEAWRVVMPFVRAWSDHPPGTFPNYTAGTWGPEEVEALIAEDGFHWITAPLED
ncbi:glucose-6-phosphate dehydrogenase [Membranicola marinus]|uniref:Glucose-6-phosphate 1-dehydrogenase n=1 Tax=Membranihabitans marinus TaxID=1227546 RepID=A0A953HYC7_9BACT|nr:glucose-6-phosphate dehydrogenase [Membranihabitans marinus]MBY5958921.1 glucose-6-phosphate dehydrogenase [Membranihabitans marinus]